MKFKLRLSYINLRITSWDKLSPFTLVKGVFKLVMLVGNCSALNMEFSLMVKCHLTKQLVVAMMHSTLSSVKLELENMYQDASSSIWSQPLLIKSEPEHIDNFSTLNNLFQEKRMLLTTLLEDITPLEKKLLIFA